MSGGKEWQKQHEELYDLNSSPNLIRVFKSRRRWADHVAGLGEGRAEDRV